MQNYTLAVLEKRFKQAQLELFDINKRINRNPYQEYLDLLRETQEKMDKFPSNLDAMKDPGFAKWISDSVKKEKELKKLFGLCNKVDIEKRLELSIEIQELSSSIGTIRIRQKL